MKKAFTLIELLVVIAIIAVLAGILFPVFTSAKGAAKGTVCLSNVRQLGLGMNLYLLDSDDTFPMDSHVGVQNSWVVQIQPYIKSKLLVRCPSDPSANFEYPLPSATQKRMTTYGVNYYMSQQDPFEASDVRGYTSLGKIENPSNTIYSAELAKNIVSEHFHPGLWYPDNMEGVVMFPSRELAQTWHHGRTHYLFVDSHAKALVFSHTFSGDKRIDLYDPRRN